MGIVCQNRAKYGHLGIIGARFGHKDPRRRMNFLRRNAKWADADIYSAAYASYNLLKENE